MPAALTILYGAIVGFSLGLTGGGGSIFAVPLLVYGLGLGAHRAVCVAMVAVGATAGIGAVQRLRTSEVEVAAGLIVAFAGTLGAPVGAWLSRFFAEKWLLTLFASIVGIVGLRMFLGASTPGGGSMTIRPLVTRVNQESASYPQFARSLAKTPRRPIALIAAGILTGILAGLLGIGGGFIIVPVLVLFGGIDIHRAIATSLFVIAVISISAVASHLFGGQRVPAVTTTLFSVGGLVGLSAGSLLGERFSGPRLQKVFAIAMLVMAAFMAVRSLRLV